MLIAIIISISGCFENEKMAVFKFAVFGDGTLSHSQSAETLHQTNQL